MALECFWRAEVRVVRSERRRAGRAISGQISRSCRRGTGDVRSKLRTHPDRSKPTVLKYFSRMQATSALAAAAEFASPSVRFRSAGTDGIVVTDGQARLVP